MRDIEQIEMINVEQLVTPTDRLLLRGRVTRRRLSTNKIVYRPAFRIELAQPTIVEPPETERTVFMRSAKRFGASTASAAVLASVFAVALVVASVY
ncbi:MAG: hypothetical protein ABI867_03445 [Kofleriaceae bacterium]